MAPLVRPCITRVPGQWNPWPQIDHAVTVLISGGASSLVAEFDIKVVEEGWRSPGVELGDRVTVPLSWSPETVLADYTDRKGIRDGHQIEYL